VLSGGRRSFGIASRLHFILYGSLIARLLPLPDTVALVRSACTLGGHVFNAVARRPGDIGDHRHPVETYEEVS